MDKVREGMFEQPPGGDGFWQTLQQTDEHGHTLSIHHVPTEQFVHYLDQRGSCVCGPSAAVFDLYGSGHGVPIVSHHPLEVKYYQDPDDPGLTVGAGSPGPGGTEGGR